MFPTAPYIPRPYYAIARCDTFPIAAPTLLRQRSQVGGEKDLPWRGMADLDRLWRFLPLAYGVRKKELQVAFLTHRLSASNKAGCAYETCSAFRVAFRSNSRLPFRQAFPTGLALAESASVEPVSSQSGGRRSACRRLLPKKWFPLGATPPLIARLRLLTRLVPEIEEAGLPCIAACRERTPRRDRRRGLTRLEAALGLVAQHRNKLGAIVGLAAQRLVRDDDRGSR